jgi:hypothetical protein
VSFLQPTPIGVDRARLQLLEAELDRREGELLSLKLELQQLQARYLDQIGSLYAELGTLEAAVEETEVRLGLRQPPLFEEEPQDPVYRQGPDDGTAGRTTEGREGCSNRSEPSADLKKVFRNIAKAVHPDRARDERARWRRHSLMAEANRAYAERDADRLLLILRAWERSPEAVVGDDPDAEALRVQRKLAAIDERLVVIEAEFADLRASAIFRLKGKIDSAKAQGWDLFGEMILQVKREIARANARLASLARFTTGAVPQP